ncbi:hypothetical protein GH714_034870 [Hevea brasiliensis]|uniref:Uncharacterized protein n=1 Tax=Hevea brasiliensis TaxID=3981 RepID=A0A6A6L747_HEVBR|nr:hypothetical protein GH714_034870 [Hevea brasiliensis]
MDLQRLKTWNSTSDDCCQWRLVSCTLQKATDLYLSDFIPSQDLKPAVTSDVLAPLFHLQTLISLDISYNNIHGEIPGVGFANLSNLVSLSMHGNSFNGPIPPSLFSLRHLEELDMSYNLIEGTLGNNFGNLSNLKQLDLGANSIHGEIPTQIGNLTNLQWLSLFRNKISGAIPPSLSHLKSLKELNLGQNFLTMELPTEIGNLSNIRWLQLCNNNLSGEIPPSIQKMEQLEVLDLENNLFAGEIPTGLFDFNYLSYLSLGENKLVLKNARMAPRITTRHHRSSHWNEYTQFRWVERFEVTELISKQLSGRIPLSFGGLQSLESLDLSHNNFSGEIPYTLANLFELSYLDLSNNKLKGRIPSGPQMDRMNDPNSYANNSGLCGMQIKVSCEKVPSEPKLKEGKTKKSNSWEKWFSWEMAVIGYPYGFLSTVLVMYVIGYFNITAQPGRRKRRRSLVRHGLFGFYAFDIRS